MAWCLVGTKLFSEPMLEYCLIWTLGPNFSEILSEIYTFFTQENAFEYVVCEMATILCWLQCFNILCYNMTPMYQCINYLQIVMQNWSPGKITHGFSVNVI